jgi:hypothetical protein
MNCDAFEAAWNEILDAETPGGHARSGALDAAADRLSERERAAKRHADGCAACRVAHERYQALRRALRACHLAGQPLAGPSPELTELVVAGARQTRRTRAREALWPLLAGLAASLAALWFSPFRPRLESFRRPDPPAPAAHAVPPSEGNRLDLAMADATTATWDLARATSGPAARLGRQMLDAATGTRDRGDAGATGPEPPAASDPPSPLLPSVLRVVTPSASGADLIQDVGDGLAAGVRPLSTRAREAFGFLRTPTLERSRRPIPQPLIKGT